MFKKLFFILLGGVILVALLGTDATAGCSIRKGKLVCTDLSSEIELVGLQNLSKTDVFACSSIYIGYAYAEDRLVNNGGNSIEANSDNFVPVPLTSGAQQVTVEQLSEDERGTATVTYSWSWDDVIWPIVAYGLGAPNDNNWEPDPNKDRCIDDITLALVAWQERKGALIVADEECITCESDCSESFGEFFDGACPDSADECADDNSGCGIRCSPAPYSDCLIDDDDEPETAPVNLFQFCKDAL
jgi:hypothetical protein